jgi:phospholipase A2
LGCTPSLPADSPLRANNCPTHVFCHPARSVDIVLNFDASSDVQKGAALDRINDFGTTKGLRFTPREHLAPLRELPKGADGQPTPLGAADTAARFRGRYAQMLDGEPVGPQTGPRDALPAGWRVKPLGAGGAAEVVYNARHQPQAARGVRMVYMPLLPHAVAPAYDPSTAKFSSSYNLVWTAAQVRTIRATAQAGYREGLETVRALVREVYEEKKARRRAGG